MNRHELAAFPNRLALVDNRLHSFHRFMTDEFPRSLNGVTRHEFGSPELFHRRHIGEGDIVHTLFWETGQYSVIQAFLQKSMHTRVHMPLVQIPQGIPHDFLFPILDTLQSYANGLNEPVSISYCGEFFERTISASMHRTYSDRKFTSIIHDVVSLSLLSTQLSEQYVTIVDNLNFFD